jgi:P-type Cu+ transporter
MDVALNFTSESLQPFLQSSSKDLRLDLFIRGVRCGHCVYKIEKALNEKASLDHYHFESGGEKLTLWSSDPQSLSEVIELINGLGFQAVPLSPDQSLHNKKSHYKLELKRLAVSAVCAGNIMLFSVAVYLGADPEFSGFFHKLSFFLVLPALLYSAFPIWVGFTKSLIHQRFNLDLPIGLALSTGFILSTSSLLMGGADIYFDSIAVVIFLVLASRFVLSRYVSRIYQKNIVHYIPGVYQARRMVNGEPKVTALNQLQAGDRVQVVRGEAIPVDGVLASPQALVDGSVLTGESNPVIYKRGDRVYAGTRLCADQCLIEVVECGEQTRVGGMIQRALMTLRHDQEESFYWVSRFTGFVLISSALTFLYYLSQGQLGHGFQRAFAIVIVACPCAVSFGLPLIRSFSGQLAVQNGLILKNPQVLKKLKKIKHIFFDKTGTLTQGRVEVDSKAMARLTNQQRIGLLSLELNMDHPISNGFKKFVKEGESLLSVNDFEYIPGWGLRGWIQGEKWEAFGETLEGHKNIVARCNDIEVAQIPITSDTKTEMVEVMGLLAQRGLQMSLLSGDRSDHVSPIFAQIPHENQGVCLSQATPEDKERLIADQPEPMTTMMVGDGINDVAAMQKAAVSLCMPGALENNMSLADISLMSGDLKKIDKAFSIWEKVESTEHKLIGFTFVYNVTCVALAASGYITPVVAAILMPLSSVTVLSLVTLNLRKL